MFDKFGAFRTTIYGLVMANVGICGMILLLWLGGTPPVWLVGFFYFLEEQGGASALYMVAVCVLVRAFPTHLVGIASGSVAVAFGLSGLMWQSVASQLFGFTADATVSDTNLIGLWISMLLLINAAGLAILFSAHRVVVNVSAADSSSDASSASSSDTEAEPAASVEKHGSSQVEESRSLLSSKETGLHMRNSLVSWNFLCLISLYSVASGQVIGMSSYLSSIPTAFDSLNPTVFTPIPFAANVIGRVFYAIVVDMLTRYTGRKGVTVGNLWINVTFIICFLLLMIMAMKGERSAWVMYLAIFIAYSSYGGSVCLASSFTKLSFPQEHIGVVIGLLFTVAAVSTTIFSSICGVGNSENSGGINRVPSDFTLPWSASFSIAVIALPWTLIVAFRAFCNESYQAVPKEME